MKITDIQNNLKNEIHRVVKELYLVDNLFFTIDIPTDKTKADLVTNIAFGIAKKIKRQPLEIAEEIVLILKKNEELQSLFSFSFASPGFINIFTSNKLINFLLEDIINNKDIYGKNNLLSGQKWVIEHTSPNPNKAMHIGHLRNNLIGTMLSRICGMCGAEVIQDCVDNDRGIAIAKAMWGFLKFKKKDGEKNKDVTYWVGHEDEWFSPSELFIKADHFVGECYLLGSEDFSSSPQSEAEVRDFVVRWENQDKDIWKLWEKIINYGHLGIEQTLARLGSKWDKVWHEHDHYFLGKDLVQHGVEIGIFKKLENLAILTNLEKYSLPDTILLKSDGTSLYITQDIALTKLKKEFYHADKLVWIIGPEQSLAMKQVFATCEQLGVGSIEDFVHITYGLVNIVDETGKIKKMSSRGGDLILIDDFINNIKNSLLESGRGYSDQEAEKIALGAIKYSILKPSRSSSVVIDLKKSIDFNGDSGVYLLYTYSRIKSLLLKKPIYESRNFSFDDSEKKILLELLYFPIIIKNSLTDYSTSSTVEYVLELAHLFNALYANERFITDDIVRTDRKMSLAKAVLVVFDIVFEIIGIEPPEKV